MTYAVDKQRCSPRRKCYVSLKLEDMGMGSLSADGGVKVFSPRKNADDTTLNESSSVVSPIGTNTSQLSSLLTTSKLLADQIDINHGRQKAVDAAAVGGRRCLVTNPVQSTMPLNVETLADGNPVDEDLEAEFISAKLLSEFRDAVQSAVDSLTEVNVKIEHDERNFDRSMSDKFATYALTKLDNWNDLDSKTSSGEPLRSGGAFESHNVTSDSRFDRDIGQRKCVNGTASSGGGSDRSKGMKTPRRNSTTPDREYASVTHGCQKNDTNAISTSRRSPAKPAAIFQHRSSLPDTRCLDVSRRRLANGTNCGGVLSTTGNSSAMYTGVGKDEDPNSHQQRVSSSKASTRGTLSGTGTPTRASLANRQTPADVKGEDGTDSVQLSAYKSSTRGTFATPSGSFVKTSGKTSNSTSSAGSGTMDEEIFIKQFDQVPKINIYSGKDLTERMNKIRDVLSDVNLDWNKRIDAAKEVRSIFFAGAIDHADFVTGHLTSLEGCFQQLVRDLRSQVVREACITIGFMAQQLGKEFGHFAEAVLPALLCLIPNSVKVMATSGTVAVRFIIQHTHYARLIPIIGSNLTSKSNIIRRQCCEFVLMVVQIWPTESLERQIASLQDSIKRGISDADAEARVFSRRAFWSFSEHFRGQADSLLTSLDATKQKQLLGEQPSNSSSSLSLNSIGQSGPSTPAHNDKSNRPIASKSVTSSNYGRLSTVSRTTPVSNANDALSARLGRCLSASISCINSDSLTMSRAKPCSIRSDQSRIPMSCFNSLRSGHKRSASFSSKQMFQLTHSYDERALQNAMSGHGRVACSSAYDLTDSVDESVRQRRSSGSSDVHARPRKTGASNGGFANIASGPMSAMERSRTRVRPSASQSQPGSRSGSPSSRLSYITHTQGETLQRGGNRASTRSALPRSHGGSREASPSRGGLGRERRQSCGQSFSNKLRSSSRSERTLSLSQGDEIERAMADALRGSGARSRAESYDSDDLNSETSSICSDGNYRPYGSLPQTEDLSEILSYLSSGSWSDRREGLLALQNMVMHKSVINRSDLKRLTEVFTRMFHDPHGKVFSVFLDTLVLIVPIYHSDLNEWLYICMTRLLTKTGVDLLASVQAKVHRALDAIRNYFPANYQFTLLARYIVDQTQSPNIKVKVSMLSHMHGLAEMMQPADFSNTSDIRLAVSRIVTWTTEPKSVEVRKAAQAVLISLYNLNPSEFSVMLSVLPKTFQDGANRILQNQLKTASETHNQSDRPAHQHRSQPSGRARSEADENVENMRPEDVQYSIRKASADISHFVDVRSSPPMRDGASWHLPVCRSPDKQGSSRPTADRHHYSETRHQDRGLRNERRRGSNVDDDSSQRSGDVVQEILIELSNHNERYDDRRTALLSLIKKAREEKAEVWDEYFNAVLLILLETLGDIDGQIRALALRVLAEFLRCHAARFGEYIELTIVRTIEAHRDPVKDVARAAEDCAMLLGRFIQPDRAAKVLRPLLDSDDFLVNLGAIKMLKQLAENGGKEMIYDILPQVIPSLLKGYDHPQSCIRKATVLCLVEIYLCVGEDLRSFLKDLNGSKIKLLNVYIKRALEHRAESSFTTPETQSPGSALDTL